LVLHKEVTILCYSLVKYKKSYGMILTSIFNKCKHRPIHEIENRLYPDYDDGVFQGVYLELREEDH
jgi:hypothetical protein